MNCLPLRAALGEAGRAPPPWATERDRAGGTVAAATPPLGAAPRAPGPQGGTQAWRARPLAPPSALSLVGPSVPRFPGRLDAAERRVLSRPPRPAFALLPAGSAAPRRSGRRGGPPCLWGTCGQRRGAGGDARQEAGGTRVRLTGRLALGGAAAVVAAARLLFPAPSAGRAAPS